LSQPVGLGRLVAGKVLLRAVLLVGLVVGFAVAALTVTGADLGASGAPARLVLWIATVGAYGALWFALAIVVAALGRPSATNATILASLWLVMVIMLPSMVNLGVTTAYPVPSRVEMIQAMREASDAATAEGSKILARYYEDHPELATGDAQQAMTDVNITRVAVNADVERRVRPVIDRFEQQVTRQQQAVDRLKVLSPAVLLQDALNDISGSGTARHRHFTAQVDRFHREWRAFFTPLVLRKASVSSLDQFPRFTYVEEPTAAMARRVGIDLLWLLVPTLLLVWLGLRRLARFPIVAS
jgi:ABC-2 type transport system permease protein